MVRFLQELSQASNNCGNLAALLFSGNSVNAGNAVKGEIRLLGANSSGDKAAFAIDWIKVDQGGKAFRTDGKKSEDGLCYGVNVLAVAPGTVVERMRNLPDEHPGVAPTGLKVSEIAGNHVLLHLGDGVMPCTLILLRSVTVHESDRVKAGDKLGLQHLSFIRNGMIA